MSTIFSLKMYFILIVTFYANSIFCQVVDTVSFGPDERHGKLDNGLTYFIRKNNQPGDEVTLRLVVNAGWRHEDAHQLGLAHLLEHVAFNGTKHYPNNSLLQYFNTLGLVPGNDWNANTGDYFTSYYVNIPSSNKEAFNNCLHILRDWTQDMQLDSIEIDNERGVVLSEFREHDPLWRAERMTIYKLASQSIYPLDWYEKHENNIKTFKQELVVSFYKDWYRPDLEAVIIVGNIDVNETEKKVKQLFADIRMPGNPVKSEEMLSRFAVPLKGKGTYVTSVHKDRKKVAIKIYQKRAKIKTQAKSCEILKQVIIGNLFNVILQKRMFLFTQSDDRPFEEFDCRIQPEVFGYGSEVEALVSQIVINPDQSVESGIKSVFSQLNAIASRGFSFSDLEKVKEIELVNLKVLQGNGAISSAYQEYFLEASAAPSLEKSLEVKQLLLKEITLGEINAYAKYWITNYQNTDIVVLAPLNVKIPAEVKIRKWLNDARKTKDSDLVQPEEVSGSFIKVVDLPVTDKKTIIKSIAKHNELGVKEVQFNNGIKLLLKQQQFERGDAGKITISGIRHGGVSLYSEDDYFNASLIGLLGVYKMGIESFNKYQMLKYLNGKEMILSFSIGELASEIYGTCKTADLDVLFQLLYVQLNSPVRNQKEFDKWEVEQIKFIQKNFRTNTDIFSDSVQKLRYKNGYAGIRNLELQDLNKIKFDRIYEIYKKEFSNPVDFTMIVTGKFDEDQVIDLFVKYFGGFKPEIKQIDGNKPRFRELAYGINKTFYLGSNEGANVVLMFPGKYIPDLRNDVMHKILGQVFNIKIRDRLREKEGGAYSPQTNNTFGKLYNGNYCYDVSFECATDNVERMIAAAKEEINKLKTEGVDEETFHKARQRTKESLQEELKSEYFWLNHLKNQCLGYENESEILKTIGLYEIVTAEEVSNAAKEYFTDENMMRFVMMPENSHPLKTKTN